MSLLFIDSFDHYTSEAQMARKYAVNNTGPGNPGRFGGYCVGLWLGSSYFQRDIGVNNSTIYFGVGFKKDESGGPSNAGPIISLLDESSVTQVSFRLGGGYQINVYRSTGSFLGATNGGVVPDQEWCFLEGKVVISDTVGEVVLRINEEEVLNLTSQDTKQGSDYIRKIKFGTIPNSLTSKWDDFYIDDAQFHGNCQVKAFMPDVDGNSVDFTRSTGSNDYECVDEIPPNDDTDYIYSETLNHKSIFGITTGALKTIKGIQVNNLCKLEASGTRRIKAICRSNGADYQSVESDVIPTGYIFDSRQWDTDPDDSNPWTQVKLEAAEFGLEITT
jgi:hypothetical protein